MVLAVDVVTAAVVALVVVVFAAVVVVVVFGVVFGVVFDAVWLIRLTTVGLLMVASGATEALLDDVTVAPVGATLCTMGVPESLVVPVVGVVTAGVVAEGVITDGVVTAGNPAAVGLPVVACETGEALAGAGSVGAAAAAGTDAGGGTGSFVTAGAAGLEAGAGGGSAGGAAPIACDASPPDDAGIPRLVCGDATAPPGAGAAAGSGVKAAARMLVAANLPSGPRRSATIESPAASPFGSLAAAGTVSPLFIRTAPR